MKAMVSAIHQTGASYYSDLVWNHDGFEDQNTPGFAASGGYPGFDFRPAPTRMAIFTTRPTAVLRACGSMA
jgi:hypothetical protein